MKILQILPELNVGGVETGTVDFARYLCDHGHEAFVVSNGGSLVADLEKSGAKHFRLPVHKKSLLRMWKCVAALRKILRDNNIDIIHARSRVPAWIAFFACQETKAVLVTTCHGYYSKHFLSSVMGWGKRVIVPSEVIGRHMISDFKVPAENIRLIPRSVDLKKFENLSKDARNKKGYVVSIVGRITPLKGHTYFLKAMAQVIRKIPNVKIWIIGDAPANKESYKEELQVLIRRMGIKDHVEFWGNRSDVPALLSKTDVLVLSTVTQEAFGRVILEAQAAGVPVVATKVGGVLEIIDDKQTGILVLPKDVDAMAKEVVRVLKDRNLRNRLITAAKKKLTAHFTLEHMARATLDVYQEVLGRVNILVIKFSSVGDVVLIIPSLKALRKKFPAARIICLTGVASRKILQSCPYVDDLIIYDPKHKDKGPLGLKRMARKLRQYKFDKVIDLQNNSRSHLLSYLSFAKESYGYNNGKMGFFLSHAIRNNIKDIPPVEHQFRVLRMVGIPYQRDTALELWPSPRDEQYVENLLESEWLKDVPNIVGINLTASAKWKTKNWPLEYFAQLCDLLSDAHMRVVITGEDKDKEAVRQLKGMTQTKFASFVGKTDILQLAALIKRCKVFLTPDSAPMHIAAAVKTPFITLFGPTDPLRHLPPADRYVVLKKNLECSPCYSTRCRVLTHQCMKDISPEEVMKKIKELIR